jgi:hypothetical protein
MTSAPERFLIAVLVAQAAVVLAAVLLVLGHAALLWARYKRYAVRLKRASEIIIEVIDLGSSSEGDLMVLRGLPLRLQIPLFAELAPNLSGEQRHALEKLATDIRLIERSEERCRSRIWWRRLQGARILTLLGGGENVIPQLFNDRRFEVRAQAAEWSADHPDPVILERLLEMLGDERTLCRFTVQDSLLRLGSATVEPLARRLRQPRRPLHEVTAALGIAAFMSEPALLEPALDLCSDSRPEVRAAAANVVGSLGGDRATAALLKLLHDSAPAVRASACRGLGKLAHWPAAAALARLLRDDTWIVRREASLALRGLGTPGILLLRRFVNDEDRFAADMAKQVLDLPDTATRMAMS